MRTAAGGLLQPRREPAREDLVFEVVHSFTTPGVTYEVREHPDGSWTCTCPDATCRQHDCKHIVYVRDKKAA